MIFPGIMQQQRLLDAATDLVLDTSGLVAYFDARVGRSQSGNTVTSWSDQSGNGNALDKRNGSPQYVANAINGRPAIQFPGSASLYRDGNQSLTNMPTGNADRTMVLVAKYLGGNAGGLAYGSSGGTNTAYRLFIAGDGDLQLHTSPGDERASTNSPGAGEGWMVHSARHSGSTSVHRRDNATINTFNQTLSTGNFRLVLAADVDVFPYTNMEIALALIYDRALSDTEMTELHAYLEQQFAIATAGAGTGGQTTSTGRTDGGASLAPVQDMELRRYSNRVGEAIWTQPVGSSLRFDVYQNGVRVGQSVSGGSFHPIEIDDAGGAIQLAVAQVNSNGQYSLPFIAEGLMIAADGPLPGALGSWNDV